MQSITQRTILAIFLQVNPPVGNLRHAVKPLLAWLRKAVPTPKPWAYCKAQASLRTEAQEHCSWAMTY
jgi:hypothetical protein